MVSDAVVITMLREFSAKWRELKDKESHGGTKPDYVPVMKEIIGKHFIKGSGEFAEAYSLVAKKRAELKRANKGRT